MTDVLSYREKPFDRVFRTMATLEHLPVCVEGETRQLFLLSPEKETQARNTISLSPHRGAFEYKVEEVET